MQFSTGPSLHFESDVSIKHVFFIVGLEPSEQGGIPLPLSTLPPSSKSISFDWNSLVEPHIPSSTPFQIRVEYCSLNISRCILDEGAPTIIYSPHIGNLWDLPILCQLPGDLHYLNYIFGKPFCKYATFYLILVYLFGKFGIGNESCDGWPSKGIPFKESRLY